MSRTGLSEIKAISAHCVYGGRMKPGVLFTVRRTPAGWVIDDHDQVGPFTSREQAVTLARGMAEATGQAGQSAYVLFISDDGSQHLLSAVEPSS